MRLVRIKKFTYFLPNSIEEKASEKFILSMVAMILNVKCETTKFIAELCVEASTTIVTFA